LIPWRGNLATRMTTHAARDANPNFSPDGQWIAFESDRSGDYEVYAIRPDGSGLRNLTNHPARDQLPAFSPDGRWLLFQSDRDGSVDIYRQQFD
jgi:TolB protein